MSFYTSLTGLNGAQADIATISNNIANVGTTGFKSSRAEFGDIFATSPLQNATSAVGSGTILKSIKQQFTQGNIQSSQNALDLAISGQGFFALKPSLTSSQTVYSRNGSFSVNNDRYVVDDQGQYVQVFPVNSDGSVTSTGIASATNLQLPLSSGLPQATNKIQLGLNLPADATLIPNSSKYNATNPYVFKRNDSATYNQSTSITIYDSLGNPTIATIYYVKTSNSTSTDPTNKWMTHVFVGDQELNPALITVKDAQSKTVYTNKFGQTTTDPTQFDPSFVAGQPSALYYQDQQTKTQSSTPASVVGTQTTFNFGDTDANTVNIVTDPSQYSTTYEANPANTTTFWGTDLFTISVDGSTPQSISIKAGSYTGEQMAAEMTRAVNAKFSDANYFKISDTYRDASGTVIPNNDVFNIALSRTATDGSAVTLTPPLEIDLLGSAGATGTPQVGGNAQQLNSMNLTRDQLISLAQEKVNEQLNARHDEFGKQAGWVDTSNPPIKVGFDVSRRSLTFTVDPGQLGSDSTLPQNRYQTIQVYNPNSSTNDLGIPPQTTSSVATISANSNWMGEAVLPSGASMMASGDQRTGITVSYNKDTRSFVFNSGSTGEASSIKVGRATLATDKDILPQINSYDLTHLTLQTGQSITLESDGRSFTYTTPVDVDWQPRSGAITPTQFIQNLQRAMPVSFAPATETAVGGAGQQEIQKLTPSGEILSGDKYSLSLQLKAQSSNSVQGKSTSIAVTLPAIPSDATNSQRIKILADRINWSIQHADGYSPATAPHADPSGDGTSIIFTYNPGYYVTNMVSMSQVGRGIVFADPAFTPDQETFTTASDNSTKKTTAFTGNLVAGSIYSVSVPVIGSATPLTASVAVPASPTTANFAAAVTAAIKAAASAASPAINSANYPRAWVGSGSSLNFVYPTTAPVSGNVTLSTGTPVTIATSGTITAFTPAAATLNTTGILAKDDQYTITLPDPSGSGTAATVDVTVSGTSPTLSSFASDVQTAIRAFPGGAFSNATVVAGTSSLTITYGSSSTPSALESITLVDKSGATNTGTLSATGGAIMAAVPASSEIKPNVTTIASGDSYTITVPNASGTGTTSVTVVSSSTSLASFASDAQSAIRQAGFTDFTVATSGTSQENLTFTYGAGATPTGNIAITTNAKANFADSTDWGIVQTLTPSGRLLSGDTYNVQVQLNGTQGTSSGSSTTLEVVLPDFTGNIYPSISVDPTDANGRLQYFADALNLAIQTNSNYSKPSSPVAGVSNGALTLSYPFGYSVATQASITPVSRGSDSFEPSYKYASATLVATPTITVQTGTSKTPEIQETVFQPATLGNQVAIKEKDQFTVTMPTANGTTDTETVTVGEVLAPSNGMAELATAIRQRFTSFGGKFSIDPKNPNGLMVTYPAGTVIGRFSIKQIGVGQTPIGGGQPVTTQILPEAIGPFTVSPSTSAGHLLVEGSNTGAPFRLNVQIGGQVYTAEPQGSSDTRPGVQIGQSLAVTGHVDTYFNDNATNKGVSDLLGIGYGKQVTATAGKGLASTAATAFGETAVTPMNQTFILNESLGENKMTFTIDGITGSITLPIRAYTGDTFAAAIQQRINEIQDPTTGRVVSGATVKYDSTNNRLVFASGTTGASSQFNVVGPANFGLNAVTQQPGNVPKITNLTQATDANNNPLYVDASGNITTVKPTTKSQTWYPLYLTPGELSFDTSGHLASPSQGVIYSPFNPGNGANPLDLTIDYGKYSTQYTQPFAVNSLTQDGYPSGQLNGLNIDSSGTVRANYTNGQTQALGKIILANFANPNGLKQIGNANYVSSTASGTPTYGQAGSDGFGSIQSGSLERSNVDITEELVNLITAQRNFQANSKAIETETSLTQTIIQIRA